MAGTSSAWADCVEPLAVQVSYGERSALYIEKYSTTHDVSDWVSYLRDYVKNWCPGTRTDLLTNENLNRIQQQGLISEAKWQMQELKKIAPYRTTSDESARLLSLLAQPQLATTPIAVAYRTEVQKLAVQLRQGHRDPATCSTITDIQAKMPPNSSQNGTGWCGAFAAAGLLSFHYHTPISATDLEVSYAAGFPQEGVRTSAHKSGTINDMIQAGRKRGFCPEAKFPSEIEGDARLIDSMRAIENFAQKTKDERESAVPSCAELSAFKNLFPSANVEQLAAMASAVGPEKIIDKIDQQQCQGSRRGDSENLKVITKARGWFGLGENQMLSALDKQLEGHAPVGINYFVDGIYSQRNSKDTHASVIMGRRWNERSQSCEYLVRNSYGSSCAGYEASVQCANGNYWMPEDIFKRDVFSISYLPQDANGRSK